jgi:hypothetical protein
MHRELVVQGKAKLKGMELIAVDIFLYSIPVAGLSPVSIHRNRFQVVTAR